MVTNNTLKIILTDDDDSDQELFQQALIKTKQSAELTTLDNGQKLLDYLNANTQENPDIIFLDINMPGKDGKQCLVEIKNNIVLQSIPVVMYTTSDSKQDIEETFQKGANLYVPKPTSFQVLVKLLSTVLELGKNQTLLNPSLDNFVLSEKTRL